ncbi:MAG TPA: hypothetical protein VE934_00405 [Polaromonas sp.]|uniref:hypothetical protein n=1 Tax=Polaromonas sp. TaxID=1869339 RepID=UPI002D5A4076|nr:hypothetical protein [Polaromonas sp.]HYW55393.1 hypothetical protein [Polaromonas sp.]
MIIERQGLKISEVATFEDNAGEVLAEPFYEANRDNAAPGPKANALHAVRGFIQTH